MITFKVFIYLFIFLPFPAPSSQTDLFWSAEKMTVIKLLSTSNCTNSQLFPVSSPLWEQIAPKMVLSKYLRFIFLGAKRKACKTEMALLQKGLLPLFAIVFHLFAKIPQKCFIGQD